jgi:hypothetical protein
MASLRSANLAIRRTRHVRYRLQAGRQFDTDERRSVKPKHTTFPTHGDDHALSWGRTYKSARWSKL